MATQSARAGHLPALDALRGLAALMIGVTHAYYFSARPDLATLGVADLIDSGYLAVDFFFVLSGFVLFLPMVRRQGEAGSYGRFIFKRFTRLWPVYAVVLGVAAFAHPLTESTLAPLPPSADGTWNVLAHVVMLPTVLLGFGPTKTGLGVDAVVWSLSVEMCFSLVLPLVARWWFRHPLLGLGVALVVSRAWDFGTTHWGPGTTAAIARGPGQVPYLAGARLVISFPGYALHFGLGMSLAYLVAVHGEELRSRLAGARATVAFTLGVVMAAWVSILLGQGDENYATDYRHWTDGVLILPAFALIITSACVLSGRTGRVLRSPFGRLLADASYPFYLVHVVVIQGIHMHEPINGWAGFGLSMATLPLSFLIAITLHYGVEKPVAGWGRRVSQRVPAGRPWSRSGVPTAQAGA